MASPDDVVPAHIGGHHATHHDHHVNVEAKRKVSILTDPPSQEKGGFYDNLAFDGPRRKISQVRREN